MKKKFRKLSAITVITGFLISSTFGLGPVLSQAPIFANNIFGSVGDMLPEGPIANLPIDDAPGVKNETSQGLNSTTFDTLVGTVTVNLPDDVAAGDTISGTVISQAVWKTDAEQAKNQAEISGYVVEVAKQPAPSQKQGTNLIDFCKDPVPDPKDHSNTVCNKWSIPSGASKIPVVLKNEKGDVVAKTEVPVNPRSDDQKSEKPNAFPVKVQDNTKYSTPSVSQAGKPLTVTGPMDGDYAKTAVILGNLTAKFLASSPRKVVVMNPSGAKGVNEVEFKFNGRTVAKCTYRTVGINLAAGKLNLLKGEQTTLTATLSGLIGLLSPVSFQLSNKSPATVTMSGGDSQIVTVDPSQVNGDTFITERALTGVQAGGFSINAVVDPMRSDKQQCGQVLNGPPIPQPSPDRPTGGIDPPLDSGGNPRGNDGPGRPPAPLQARYRVTLNGFTVNHVTNHGLFQRPDAVTFHPDVEVVDVSGRVSPFIRGGGTNVIGMTPENPIRGGTSSENGGFQTGDGFPTQSSPWHRTLPLSSGAPGTIPPTVFFENVLVQNGNAALIIPDIWSVDGSTDLDLRGSYLTELTRARTDTGAAISRMITTPRRMALSNFLFSGSAVGIRNTMLLPFGRPQNRPIGIQPVGSQFGFTPQVLVLTYDSADYLANHSFGFGDGIVPVHYVDASGFGGDYTLYLQVERVDPTAPCASTITGSHFTGHAELTTTREEAAGPFPSEVNISVDFVECRGRIRITNFPPLTNTSDTSLGSNTSSLTMTAGGEGSFDSTNGHIEIPITLGLVNSLRVFGNSTLPVVLSGRRDPLTGTVTLSGNGTFSLGALGGFQGRIVVTNGNFSPAP